MIKGDEVPNETRFKAWLTNEDPYLRAELGNLVKLVAGSKITDEKAQLIGVAIRLKVIVEPLEWKQGELSGEIQRLIKREAADLTDIQAREIERLMRLVPDIPMDIVCGRLVALRDKRDPGNRFYINSPLKKLLGQSLTRRDQGSIDSGDDEHIRLVSQHDEISIPYDAFKFLLFLAMQEGWAPPEKQNTLESENTVSWREVTFSERSALSLLDTINKAAAKNQTKIEGDMKDILDFLKKGSFTAH